MTKNGLDIKAISTKRKDLQTDLDLLLGQLTEKKEEADPSQNSKSRLLTTSPTINRILLQ